MFKYKSPSLEDLYAEIVGAIYLACAKSEQVAGECNCLELIKPIKERFLNV